MLMTRPRFGRRKAIVVMPLAPGRLAWAVSLVSCISQSTASCAAWITGTVVDVDGGVMAGRN